RARQAQVRLDRAGGRSDRHRAFPGNTGDRAGLALTRTRRAGFCYARQAAKIALLRPEPVAARHTGAIHRLVPKTASPRRTPMTVRHRLSGRWSLQEEIPDAQSISLGLDCGVLFGVCGPAHGSATAPATD